MLILPSLGKKKGKCLGNRVQIEQFYTPWAMNINLDINGKMYEEKAIL